MMQRVKYVLIFLVFIAVIKSCETSCSRTSESSESVDSEAAVSATAATADTSYGFTSGGGYSDGTYCADIDYYNPNTGTRSTYTLNVDVENNELTVIHWPNGGWLDDSHFYPEELDSSGYCSFTSDKGYQYTVQITGSECSYTDENRVSRDLEDEKDAVTCPYCGGEKDEYDSYCRSCKDKRENTCSRCGGLEYYVYGGLCNNCKRNDEDRQREEEESNE